FMRPTPISAACHTGTAVNMAGIDRQAWGIGCDSAAAALARIDGVASSTQAAAQMREHACRAARLAACTGEHRRGAWPLEFPRDEEVAEPACKPGSVVDSHSSRRTVTGTLKQPTRRHRGPRHGLPIWSCSRWGLPCRPVARLAVRSYRTISPLPAFRRRRRRYLSVALSVGSRRPGVTWH